jgi:hypothetical protein
VCVFLVHPEPAQSLFSRVDKKLAKGQMQQPDRRILVVGNTKNRVQRVKLTCNIFLWNLKKAYKRDDRKRTL